MRRYHKEVNIPRELWKKEGEQDALLNTVERKHEGLEREHNLLTKEHRVHHGGGSQPA